ncbi:MAG TPA: serine hydrolase domain-containing protein [Sedimentisphaerales bacterium]|nr:serine hydrolase domain-containing protein [Sedimentisphaerales bacterium]
MARSRYGFLCALTVLVAFSSLALGQGLPKASPKSVGLSQDRLDRITAVMQKHVDEGLLAGAVAMVAREGKVAYVQSVGMQDREKQVAMNPQTIFRIASMSKAITSVAAMMLYEEGKFRLSDPVSKFIPEFADVKVLAPGDPSAQDGVVAARRPITIRHLLTHTSGLTYQWDDRVGKRYAEAGITHGLIQDEDSLAEDMKKLARIPLVHQPGEAFTYSLSTDVLGRVVEVASGMPFDEFLQKRIFTPLKMNDTGFRLPESKVSRLAAVYAPDADGGLKRLPDGVLGEGNMKASVNYPYAGTHNYRSGGGGLCSTVPDYVRFIQMMLNKGELDGVRLLSPKTVEMMSTDQVGDLNQGAGFGLGFGVTRTLRESELTSVGAYRWGGYWYTTFFIDPSEKMIGVCMAQISPSGKATLNDQFEALAHQAIVE